MVLISNNKVKIKRELDFSENRRRTTHQSNLATNARKKNEFRILYRKESKDSLIAVYYSVLVCNLKSSHKRCA